MFSSLSQEDIKNKLIRNRKVILTKECVFLCELFFKISNFLFFICSVIKLMRKYKFIVLKTIK